MKNIILSMLVLLILGAEVTGQQELQQSNDQFSLMNFNPSSAGIYRKDETTGSAYLSYRNQWIGYEGAPKTYSLLADYFLKDYNTGIGLSMYSDNIGIDSKLEIAGNYSYRLPLREGFLQAGIRTAFTNFGSEFSEIRHVDQGDIYDNISERFSLFSVGFGMIYHSDNLRLGVSMPAIAVIGLQENRQFRERHLYCHASVKFGEEKDFLRFEPSFLFKYQRSVPVQAKLGLIAWINDSLSPGIYYRWGDALAFSLGWLYNDQIQLGLAYDVTLSNLRKVSDNSFEIHMGYLLN